MISSLYKYLLLLKGKHENPRNEERAIGPRGVAVLEENSFRNIRDSDTPALSAGAEENLSVTRDVSLPLACLLCYMLLLSEL